MERSIRRFLLAVMLVTTLVQVVAVPTAAAADDEVVLTLFWGDGCPHCAAEKAFLEVLSGEVPQLAVDAHEVYYDLEARARFVETMTALGMEARAVPTTIVGARVWVGFSDAIAEEIRAEVVAAAAAIPSDGPVPDDEVVDIPVIGSVDAATVSLLPATFFIALVDGLNPCSLWALSILLALVLRTGSRRRVLAVGGVFLFVTAALYGLYVAGMYGALTFAAQTTWIRLVMAAVALAFGIVNVKDYFRFQEGLSLSIPGRAKPKLYARMRTVSDPSRPLPAVLMGTGALAVGVSLLETPCTAGYPVLWADLVSSRGLGLGAASGLFSLYMLVFLADELVVFGAAVVLMRVSKLEERGGRILKLVSGVLMVILAAVLIFLPRAMESVSGALVVFGLAAAITGIVLLVDRLRVRRHAPVARDPARGTAAGAGRR
jgi:glutaredoxin